jgi:hypothetical protein
VVTYNLILVVWNAPMHTRATLEKCSTLPHTDLGKPPQDK